MTPALRKTAVAAAAAAVATMLVLYYVADPESDILPRCMFKAITGLDCPGCGSQRALHAMLHGRIAEAFRFNPAVFVMMPLVAFYALAEWSPAKHPRLRAALLRQSTILLILAAIILWTVARNIFI